MTDIQARIDTTLAMIDKLPYYQNNDLYNKSYVDKAIREVLENAKSIIKELQAQLQRHELKKDDESIVRSCLWRDMQTVMKDARKEIEDRDAVIAELRKENEWQDIESAPRGYILVWQKDYGLPIIAKWNGQKFDVGGSKQPTHWSRLIEPPKGI